MLIGLSGLKGCGKSTVAKRLCEKYAFTEFSFADPLKRGVMEMFGLDYEQVYVRKENTDPFWDVMPRKLLQIVGTDLIRNQLPLLLPEMRQVWIRRMERNLVTHSSQNIVISDVRFEDEAAFVRNKGGVLLRVHRPALICTDMHESELLGFDYDEALLNQGTLDEFYRTIDDWYIKHLVCPL